MNDRNRTLLFGTLIGAATGLIGAMLLQRRAEEQGTQITLSTGDGMRIGMMLIGLVRAVASLGDDKENA